MTKIEWAHETWNPITGCSPVSAGCQNCYARRMAKRLAGRFGYPKNEPFRPGTVHEDKLCESAHWRKPRRVFVCSMGDLFHGDVDYVAQLAVMSHAQTYSIAYEHTFMFLTKRPRLMHDFLLKADIDLSRYQRIWLGVTAENQAMADERIPALLQIPAAVRFVSVEPMLEYMRIEKYMGYYEKYNLDGPEEPKLDWVICGGETGPCARAMELPWAQDLRDQCVTAGVPFFFKQHGSWVNRCMDDPRNTGRLLDGREWNEVPAL